MPALCCGCRKRSPRCHGPAPTASHRQIELDEATILAAQRRYRAGAARGDLRPDRGEPLQARCARPRRGHEGPWRLHLSVQDGRLALAIARRCAAIRSRPCCSALRASAARCANISRSAISYYSAIRKASAQEIETIDMARRAIHDRAARLLLEAARGQGRNRFRHGPAAVHADLRAAYQGLRERDANKWAPVFRDQSRDRIKENVGAKQKASHPLARARRCWCSSRWSAAPGCGGSSSTGPRRGSNIPAQGVLVSADDGRASFVAFKAIGADFAYLEASRRGRRSATRGSRATSTRCAPAGLPFGAVHHYDPCIPADRQAANFVTVVPRDDTPAAARDRARRNRRRMREAGQRSGGRKRADDLPQPGRRPCRQAGDPQDLSRPFEDRYHLAGAIDRNLWLTRDRFQPDYAGRPWTLWTANSQLRSEAGSTPVRWVVAQP